MDLRTGESYWIATNGPFATYPALHHDETCDIAVIGGGVTGALTAHALARDGVNVVIIDRRRAATGSSAASTGLLLYDTDTSLAELARTVGLHTAVRSYQLGREAIDHVERIVGALGDDCGFARRPGLYLASSQGDVRALQDEHALRRAHGFDVDFLSDSQIKERFAIDAPGALYTPNEGEIDSYRFTHRLLSAATAAGARVYDETAVLTTDRVGTSFELKTNTDCVVRARRIVWATGYETANLVDAQLTDLNSTWACATDAIDHWGGWPERCLLWETARPYFYLRTTADGRFMIGGEDSPFSRRHQSRRLLQKKTQTLLDRLRELIGVDAAATFSWAGVFGETRDGLPYIGHGEDPDVWYALGYGGNGITFSMIAARIIHDAWLGVANPDLNLLSFDRSQD
ncbi:MAG TPA: FAD-dependent oxidoreductase [Vicinamibacterales bacterium]|nr:FAD-dependent oxidoreductase [Vicinamibacterales bacterium]